MFNHCFTLSVVAPKFGTRNDLFVIPRGDISFAPCVGLKGIPLTSDLGAGRWS